MASVSQGRAADSVASGHRTQPRLQICGHQMYITRTSQALREAFQDSGYMADRKPCGKASWAHWHMPTGLLNVLAFDSWAVASLSYLALTDMLPLAPAALTVTAKRPFLARLTAVRVRVVVVRA